MAKGSGGGGRLGRLTRNLGGVKRVAKAYLGPGTSVKIMTPKGGKPYYKVVNKGRSISAGMYEPGEAMRTIINLSQF